MTSGSTFPQRLTKIDDLALPDHYYLTAEDDCYFLGEYTARKGYAFSPTNQLVLNFCFFGLCRKLSDNGLCAEEASFPEPSLLHHGYASFPT